MPLDPNIILQAGKGVTPLKDPSEIADEQAVRQMRQLQMQTAQQGITDDQALRQAYQSGQTGPELIKNLQGQGLYKPAMELQKFQAEQDKSQGERGKLVAEGMKNGAGMILANPTEENAIQTLTMAQQQYGLPAQMVDGAKAQIYAARNDPNKLKQLAVGWGGDAEKVLGKFTSVNMGGTQEQQRVNPVTGQMEVAGIQTRTQSPDSLASVGQSAANAAMTDARAREANQIKLTQGRVPANYEPDPDKPGSVRPISGGPADPMNAKGSTEYNKHALALQNMNEALTNYKSKLDGFGTLDMLNPSARAEMGTAYNNAMLQAKEMYALGVLNGGDERILKSILNSPLDWNSAIIPKDALKKQADDLQGILVRNNEALARVNKQPVQPLAGVPAAPAAKPAGPQAKQKAINVGGKDYMAELAPDGKYYVQQNGKWAEVR